MATAAEVKSGSGSGQAAGEGRLSWPVFLLAVAAVTSSSLSALSLHQLLVLRAEVEGLKSEVGRRKEEGRGARDVGQMESISNRRSSQEYLQQSESRHAFNAVRRRRTVPGAEAVSQPCLQLLPNSSKKNFTKEISSHIYTGLPWQAGLRRGSALEADNNHILVREEGYYFVYSQVYYMDAPLPAMGHVVIRWKKNVVPDEQAFEFLFRCIQTMDHQNPYNTCYTGGIVKLDVEDYVELLIPRDSASLSLDGDSTFLGAFKLG